jgi:hypothetical protein
MRELATAPRIREFMRRLGERAGGETTVYLTGGATAVLLGWRESTLDVDIKVVPERDDVLRAVQELKDLLQINVELASPDLFIPPVPGWESRSPSAGREGRIEWRHFDPYSQALAKIERGHEQDAADVKAMLARGLIEPARLRDAFERIRPELYRYPALDAGAFARRVEEALA